MDDEKVYVIDSLSMKIHFNCFSSNYLVIRFSSNFIISCAICWIAWLLVLEFSTKGIFDNLSWSHKKGETYLAKRESHFFPDRFSHQNSSKMPHYICLPLRYLICISKWDIIGVFRKILSEKADAKGQLFSEWIYEVIVSPNIL